MCKMFVLLVLVMMAGAEDGIMTTPAANSSRLVKRTIMPHMHERCYGIYGCFSIARPWTSNIRPINNYPEGPQVLNPRYCLYTRHHGNQCQYVVTGDLTSLNRSGIQSSRPVLFIAHGYLENGGKKWIKRMVDEALIYDDLNVFVVDWVGGSGPPYSQAANNIRLVGVMVAHLILFLQQQVGIRPERCHIVGHSLGAHLAGYTGSYLNERGLKLGRITGLDPADPYFENTERMIRLDSSDALFVDVIHTDAAPFITGGLGLMQLSGHVDFYPNGGVQQPGCGESVLDSIEKEQGSVIYGLRRFIGCNHIRSYEFFTESFNSKCPFLSVQCGSWEEFLTGSCTCGANNCFYMGYKANLLPPGTAIYRPEMTKAYLMTGSVKPFCQYHYQVTIVISDTEESVRHGSDRGYLTVQLHGDQSISAATRLTSESIRLEPGKAYSYVLSSHWLGRIQMITVEWHYASSVFNPFTWRIMSVPAIHINRIIVHNYETNNSTEICGEDLALTSHQRRPMYPLPRCRQQSWNPVSIYDHTSNSLRRKGRKSRSRKILNWG